MSESVCHRIQKKNFRVKNVCVIERTECHKSISSKMFTTSTMTMTMFGRKNYAKETLTCDIFLFSFSIRSIETEKIRSIYFYVFLVLLLFACRSCCLRWFTIDKNCKIKPQIGQRVVRFSNINPSMSAISYEIQCAVFPFFFLQADLYLQCLR